VPTAPSLRRSHFGRDFEGELAAAASRRNDGPSFADVAVWPRWSILLAIAMWGVSAWSFFPVQQARLISIAGVKVAPVALSLNASFQFLGFSSGAALGSLTLANASSLALGWVGAICVIAALSLALAACRRARSLSPVMP